MCGPTQDSVLVMMEFPYVLTVLMYPTLRYSIELLMIRVGGFIMTTIASVIYSSMFPYNL